MEQEATDELVLIELHDFLSLRVRGVAYSERDATVFDLQDVVVRDRDAMGVGAEVVEHTLQTGERRLRIDNPVAPAKRIVESQNGCVVTELPGLEGASETFEEFCAEHLGQSAHRKKKAFVPGRDEALLVQGQAASRDDAVQMRME